MTLPRAHPRGGEACYATRRPVEASLARLLGREGALWLPGERRPDRLDGDREADAAELGREGVDADDVSLPERLEKQVAEAEAGLDKAKQDIVRLKGDLESGQTIFVYAGRTYTAGEVKTDLANRFERYKTSEATLASLQGIYDARQRSLDAARQELEGMLAEKRRAEVEVENLDARLKKLAAAQTTSDYNFDDSKLSRVKDLIDDLRTRLDVAERLVDAEGYLQGQIPLDEEAPEDIVEQVTEYFGPPEPAPEALAHAEE